jgi:chemotaxis protein CheD
MMENELSHFLYPSALFFSGKPHVVNTILGSCVAVCLWDKHLNVGGINHYMLPMWNGDGLASPKYGNIAIDKLIDNMMHQLGCQKRNLQAKVFGGGEVIETKVAAFNIGKRNIEVAKEQLQEHNIPIVAMSVGGNQGRKIQYFTQTGKVKMKLVQKHVLPPAQKNLHS